VTVPPRFGEEREPRNFLGWILTLLLVLVTSGYASYYYTTVGSAQYQKAQVVDRAFRDAVLARKSFQPIKWRIFDQKLAPLEKSDPRRFSLLRAVSSYERTKTVDPQDIERLKASNNRAHRIVADIYTKSFSKEQIGNLDGQITRDLFTGTMAGIHLHERNGDAGYRAMHLPSEGKASSPTWKLVSNYIAGAIMVIAGLIGAMMLVLYTVFRSIGLLKPLGHPLQNIGLLDADRLAMRAAQIMAGIAAVSLLASYFNIFDREMMSVFEAGLTISLVLLITLTPIWGKRFTPADLGLTRRNFFKNVGWGVGAFFANIPILYMVTIISSQLFTGMPNVNHPIVSEVKNASSIVVWIAIFISASVQAPIVEETLFRGSLLPAMARIFKSPVLGIVLSSLIFAMGHSTGLPSWLPLATIGAMAAALTYQTRSLVPAMVLHAVHNGSMLLITILFS